jgi:hypothetical protein
MATYKNSYTKKEDSLLWELHEIRHRLHEARKEKSIQEINSEAMNKFHNWKKQRRITHR